MPVVRLGGLAHYPMTRDVSRAYARHERSSEPLSGYRMRLYIRVRERGRRLGTARLKTRLNDIQSLRCILTLAPAFPALVVSPDPFLRAPPPLCAGALAERAGAETRLCTGYRYPVCAHTHALDLSAKYACAKSNS